MHDYGLAVDSVAALFDASGHVDRDGWRAFVGTLDIERNMPGARSLAFIKSLPADEVENFLFETRNDGAPAFDLRPRARSRRR